MNPFGDALPLVWQNVGVVVGLVLSLFIFSFVLRETVLARLAQYLLVGVSLGYVVVLVWHSVLLPRLVQPLLRQPVLELGARPLGPESLWLYWIALALGGLLWLAGIDHLFGARVPWWRRARSLVRGLALLPLGIMVGTTLGAVIAGTVQGTLVPQFLRAARLGISENASWGLFLTGVLTLLITGGALLHLQIGVQQRAMRTLPASLHWLIGGWLWLGQRALWLAAGVLFARLLAARVTLLIARLSYFLYDLRQSDLWLWLRAVLGGLG